LQLTGWRLKVNYLLLGLLLGFEGNILLRAASWQNCNKINTRNERKVLTSNTTFSFAFGFVRGFAWNAL
jgi:hypothetical protein